MKVRDVKPCIYKYKHSAFIYWIVCTVGQKKNVMCTHLDLPEQIHTKNKERNICSIVNGSSPVCRHLMFFFLCFPLFIAISLSPLIPLHYYIPFDWSQKMPDKSIKLCEVRELLIYYYYYECCRFFLINYSSCFVIILIIISLFS